MAEEVVLPKTTCSPKEAPPPQKNGGLWRREASRQSREGHTLNLFLLPGSSVPVPLRTDHESQMAQALRTDWRLPGLVKEGYGGDGHLFFFFTAFL